MRAKVNARRRRDGERTAREGAEVNAKDLGSNRLETVELRSLIDEELERLPQRYRTPLVLCDLEGQTHEQAAVQLRCPVGTVKSRLARGRERLRLRLGPPWRGPYRRPGRRRRSRRRQRRQSPRS